MLESVKRFRDSITDEQRQDVKTVLGDELAQTFNSVLESETEQQVKERIGLFIAAVRKQPVKMFRLRRKLTDEQKVIVDGFLED